MARWTRFCTSFTALLIAAAAIPGFAQESGRQGVILRDPDNVFGPPEAVELPEEPEEIETDRDSFTPATTTAGRGRLIAESAWTFIDNRKVKETHSFPEAIFRYGLNDWIELRLGWNYEVGGAGSDVSGTDAGGDQFDTRNELERESSLSYGLKFIVTRQCGYRPASAVIIQASTPTSGENSTTDFVATYVFGWELSNEWKLDAAVRYGTADEAGDRFDNWAPSIVLKAPVGERAAAHVEYFGIFSTHRSENFERHYISPGIHWLITPDIEIGFRVGWGLNDQSARFFSNVGIGLQF